jgi:hypothetical protein
MVEKCIPLACKTMLQYVLNVEATHHTSRHYITTVVNSFFNCCVSLGEGRHTNSLNESIMSQHATTNKKIKELLKVKNCQTLISKVCHLRAK